MVFSWGEGGDCGCFFVGVGQFWVLLGGSGVIVVVAWGKWGGCGCCLEEGG